MKMRVMKTAEKKWVSMFLVAVLAVLSAMTSVSAKEPDGSSVKYDYAELCEEYMEYIATNFPDRGDIQEGVDPGEDNRHEECRAYLISELKKAVPRSFPGPFPCLFASAVRPDGAGCRGRRGIVVFVL